MQSKIRNSLLLLIVLFDLSSATIRGLDECSNTQVMSILPSAQPCMPRPTVVELDLPNDTYVHIVPNHVEVNRCGGSCQSRQELT